MSNSHCLAFHLKFQSLKCDISTHLLNAIPNDSSIKTKMYITNDDDIIVL